MNKSVRIDVVEIVTLRNIGEMTAKDRGDVGVFTVKVSYVRHKLSLLQQVGAAREIRDPRLSLLGPRCVAIEPLPERTE